MIRLFIMLSLPCALLITGCDERDDNPCVKNNKVCCVVETGPNESVSMCTPTPEACLAKRPPGTVGPYPRANESRAINSCFGS